MAPPRYHFSTRDLLMMAALAALGGVTGTYVNALGDLVQSVIGMPGMAQWAAGLHVVWLTLAVGLTRKLGAGTVTGVLVDLGFLPFRRGSWPGFLVAGGLAGASNVIVFQLMASLPADLLAFGALAAVAAVAGMSGVVFGGALGRLLLGALQRAGVVDQAR